MINVTTSTEEVSRQVSFAATKSREDLWAEVVLLTDKGGLLTGQVVEGIRLYHKVYRVLIFPLTTLDLVPCLSLIPQM